MGMGAINRVAIFILLTFPMVLCKAQTIQPDREIIRSIYRAVERGDTARVVSLIKEKKYPVNSIPENKSRTLLSEAVIAKQSDMVKVLLAYGATPSEDDFYLTWNYEIQRMLVFAGANLSSPPYEWIEDKMRFVHTAIEYDDYEALNMIPFTDEEINSGSCEGYTALTLAVAQNKPKMVLYLLMRGADKNTEEVAYCLDEFDAKTPAELANELGYTDIIKILDEWE